MTAAVVFDLDYTLAVPDRSRAALLAESTSAVGAPEISREEYLEAHADYLDAETRTPIFATILPEDDDTAPEDLAEAYRKRVTASLSPVEGVPGLLADLRENYALGLLTNGPVRAQQAKLDRFDWVDAFDAVAITGHLDAGKPDERAFEAILADLGVQAESTAYVGDDPEMDVEGPRKAGMGAVQVVFDGGPDPHPDADAHVARDSLAADLPGVLDGL